jgi:superfamily II DNA or RNA helicase
MAFHAQPGSVVTVRDQPWRVTRVDEFDRCAVLTLDAADRKLRVIAPFDRVTVNGRTRVMRRNRRTVLRTALRTIASARPPTGLWTAAAAAIDLIPYQLEPALAVLRGATRLLIADAVGLGKTIQAGLILSELRERGWVDRALVVCPAGLRATWADELRQRFGIASTVIDQAAICETAAALPPGINPWTTHLTAIASIDYIKRPEVLAAISEVPIDLIIADEAHHLTPGTDRGAAVCRLASRAPWSVLLSATPHSGDENAFDYLTRIGAHHDELTTFRRSRRNVGPRGGRRERLIRMRPAPPEIELLDGVESYAKAIWNGRGASDPAARLVAITIARRAASSTLALERTLRRRLMLLDGRLEPAQVSLPWEEEDDADDCGSSAVLAVAGLPSETQERAAIDELLSLIGRCGQTAKLEWLATRMARFKEPAIVFTEYRDTLEAIVAVLPRQVRIVSICGATPIGERRQAIDAFNHDRADVLIATDTAGEGLNLHYRCRLVIDVELPWNPLRLEQRIGRVDRLGQRRRVHGLRLFYPNTIEERVLERLQLRRRRGDWLDDPEPIDELAVAAAAFGDGPAQSPPTRHLATARVEAAACEHARLLRQRALANVAMPADRAFAAVPKRNVSSRVVALHTVAYVNGCGSLVAEQPSAHAVDVGRPRTDQRRHVFVRAVSASSRLDASVSSHVVETCAEIESELTPLRTAIRARIAAIRSQIACQRAREVQGSLFDRREDAEAAQAEQIAGVLDAALLRRGCSIDARVSATTPRLAAVWPAARR